MTSFHKTGREKLFQNLMIAPSSWFWNFPLKPLVRSVVHLQQLLTQNVHNSILSEKKSIKLYPYVLDAIYML
jgi:hypothetical protein